jgi:hypothetical protein
MPIKTKRTKKTTKNKSKNKTKSKTKKTTRKKSSINKTKNIEPKVDEDFFTDLDTSMSYDDMTKDGILEKLKDKLLHNVFTTRYQYLSWFNRFNRGYELVDFLTFYIKNFLQANNPIINEIYLYVRNNNINRFSDFTDHYYLKNKIVWIREKLVNALDKFITSDTPPLYYSDLASLFLRPKNIYLLKDNDYFITRREDDYKNKLEEIKNLINTSKQPPKPPPSPPSPPSYSSPPPSYSSPSPPPPSYSSPSPPPQQLPKEPLYDKNYIDNLKKGYDVPDSEINARIKRAEENGIVDPNTKRPYEGLEDLYQEILDGAAGFKNKKKINKSKILSFTNFFL